MRRHGAAAKERQLVAHYNAWARAQAAHEAVVVAMWSARVHREARRGARIVAGIDGAVLRVDSVGVSGYGVHTTTTPFLVRADVLARTGCCWVEDDLKDLVGRQSGASPEAPPHAAHHLGAGRHL